MNCKIFFKRCVDLSKTYSCKRKTPGYCDQSYEIPLVEKCKGCRYLKCLSVGMDPSKIKAGEERKKFVRHKLYCFKKSNQPQTPIHTQETTDMEIDNHPVNQNHPQESIIDQPSDQIDTQDLMTQIVKAHEASVGTIQLNKQLMEFLVSGHLYESYWTFEHSEAFIKAMEMHPKSIMKMTFKLDCYQEICKDDQSLLYKNNLSLYSQYIMSRYFMAQGGSTQLFWLFGFDPEKVFGK